MLRMWFDLSWQHHYCVYCLTDPEGKRYFGISRYSAAKRWKNGKGFGGNRRLKNAIALFLCRLPEGEAAFPIYA